MGMQPENSPKKAKDTGDDALAQLRAVVRADLAASREGPFTLDDARIFREQMERELPPVKVSRPKTGE